MSFRQDSKSSAPKLKYVDAQLSKKLKSAFEEFVIESEKIPSNYAEGVLALYNEDKNQKFEGMESALGVARAVDAIIKIYDNDFKRLVYTNNWRSEYGDNDPVIHLPSMENPNEYWSKLVSDAENGSEEAKAEIKKIQKISALGAEATQEALSDLFVQSQLDKRFEEKLAYHINKFERILFSLNPTGSSSGIEYAWTQIRVALIEKMHPKQQEEKKENLEDPEVLKLKREENEQKEKKEQEQAIEDLKNEKPLSPFIRDEVLALAPKFGPETRQKIINKLNDDLNAATDLFSAFNVLMEIMQVSNNQGIIINRNLNETAIQRINAIYAATYDLDPSEPMRETLLQGLNVFKLQSPSKNKLFTNNFTSENYDEAKTALRIKKGDEPSYSTFNQFKRYASQNKLRIVGGLILGAALGAASLGTLTPLGLGFGISIGGGIGLFAGAFNGIKTVLGKAWNWLTDSTSSRMVESPLTESPREEKESKKSKNHLPKGLASTSKIMAKVDKEESYDEKSEQKSAVNNTKNNNERVKLDKFNEYQEENLLISGEDFGEDGNEKESKESKESKNTNERVKLDQFNEDETYQEENLLISGEDFGEDGNEKESKENEQKPSMP